MIKLKDIIEGRENWSAEDWSNYHTSLGTAYIKRKKQEERKLLVVDKMMKDKKRKLLTVAKILRDEEYEGIRTRRPPNLPINWQTDWRTDWLNIEAEVIRLLEKLNSQPPK